jgi:hypothetical protein
VFQIIGAAGLGPSAREPVAAKGLSSHQWPGEAPVQIGLPTRVEQYGG